MKKKAAKREHLTKRDGYCCAKCGSVKDITLDHIIPKCKGGRDIIENLQLLCFSCNQEKGNLIRLYTKDRHVYRHLKKQLKLVGKPMISYLGG